MRDKIKSAMLRTSQHVAVSEMERMLDPELWPPGKITVLVFMILGEATGRDGV